MKKRTIHLSLKNWDDYNSVAISDFVTHWMPLPDPPVGGDPA